MATASLVDKATNGEFLTQPDWSVNTELIDVVNGVPELVPGTLTAIFGKLQSRDGQTQLLALHLLDALMKSCKSVPSAFKGHLRVWEAYVSDKSRAPQAREKCLELTDLWSRSLGGPFSDVASNLARQGLQFRGKPQPAGLGPHVESPPQPGRLPALAPTNVLPAKPPAPSGGNEVDTLRESVNVLHDILAAADPKKPIGMDEVVGQLIANLCQDVQPRLAVLIEHGNLSEDLFALNDLCLRVQDMYGRLQKGMPALDKPLTPPVAKASPPPPPAPLVSFDESPHPPSGYPPLPSSSRDFPPMVAMSAPAPAPSPIVKTAPPQQIYGISVASTAAAEVPLLRPPPAGSVAGVYVHSPMPAGAPQALSAHANVPVARAAPAVDEEDEFAVLARRPTKGPVGSGSQPVLMFPTTPSAPASTAPPPSSYFDPFTPSVTPLVPQSSMPAHLPQLGAFAPPIDFSSTGNYGVSVPVMPPHAAAVHPLDPFGHPIDQPNVKPVAPIVAPGASSPFAGLYDLRTMAPKP